MRQTYHIHNQFWVQANSQQVFDFFANHHHFTSLFGTTCKVVAMAGEGGHGLHSVRRMNALGSTFDEHIVHFEPTARLDYAINDYGFLPIREHHGRLDFDEIDGGTLIQYHITFCDALPVPFMGWFAKKAVQSALSRHAIPALQKQLNTVVHKR